MLLQTPIAVPLTDKSKEELVHIVEMMQEDLRWYVDERNRLLAHAPAESAAPERDSQKVDPLADRPTFSTPHAASLVESIKTTVSSRTTTNGPCYDPLTPADAGKELRALSAKWRKPGAGIVSHEFDGPIAVEQFYDASRLQCADELDALLALLSEGEK
jgi:hypothetical protein